MIRWVIALLLVPSLAFAGFGMGPGPGVGAFGGGGGSSLAFVQSKAVYSKTSSITLDSAATGGNQLVAVLLNHNASIESQSVSVSGGCATTWTTYSQRASGAYTHKIFYCSNASSGSNAVTPSGWVTGDGAWYLVEISGATTGLENSAIYATTAATFSSGTAAASGAALLIGTYDSSSTTGVETWQASWLQRSALTTHRSSIATKVVAVGGSYDASGTVSANVVHGSSVWIIK